MLWLETYLHCCSVRLGVIIMTIIKALEHITISLILLAWGTAALEPILKLTRNNQQAQQISIIKYLLHCIDHSSSTFLLTLQIYMILYISGCLLALYGALKLRKWYLWPFIIFDGIQIAIDMIAHVLLMIVLKNHINLGALIGATLLGAFIILFLGYNWTAAVAMFQIVQLINSKYYQGIYRTLSSSTSTSSLTMANNLKSFNKVKILNTTDNQREVYKKANVGMNANNVRVYKKPQIAFRTGVDMTKNNKKDMMSSQFKQYAWWKTKHHQQNINNKPMHNNWLYGELVNNKRASNIILTKF